MRAPRQPPGPPRERPAHPRYHRHFGRRHKARRRSLNHEAHMRPSCYLKATQRVCGRGPVREEKRKAVLATMLKVKEVLFSSEEIEEKVRELGEHITEDYQGEEPLLVGILRGAVVVLADLMRCVELPC